jgi:hypothetical protein
MVSAIVAALTALVGGIFGYVRFLKGRLFKRRCQIDISGEQASSADMTARL